MNNNINLRNIDDSVIASERMAEVYAVFDDGKSKKRYLWGAIQEFKTSCDIETFQFKPIGTYTNYDIQTGVTYNWSGEYVLNTSFWTVIAAKMSEYGFTPKFDFLIKHEDPSSIKKLGRQIVWLNNAKLKGSFDFIKIGNGNTTPTGNAQGTFTKITILDKFNQIDDNL